ncbi:hypothetical protein vseg_016770 [Gypsophila vaccaria]
MVFSSLHNYYTDKILPNLLIRLISTSILIKTFIATIINLMGLAHLVEPEVHWPKHESEPKSKAAALIQEILPVTKYSRLIGTRPDQTETCAICLHEFRHYVKVRQLGNCNHIFHKSCLDRWIEHDLKSSCPLCRTSIVPYNLVDNFNKRLVEEEDINSSFPEFGSEFCVINTFS